MGMVGTAFVSITAAFHGLELQNGWYIKTSKMSRYLRFKKARQYYVGFCERGADSGAFGHIVIVGYT